MRQSVLVLLPLCVISGGLVRKQPLLQKDFTERRKLLNEHFQPVDLEFQFAKSSDCETTDEIQTFLEESVKDG